MTTHYLASIETGIKAAAKDAGNGLLTSVLEGAGEGGELGFLNFVPQKNTRLKELGPPPPLPSK